MNAGAPSKTAQSAAVRRAEHQLFDQPCVLEDPIAPRIIGAAAVASMRMRSCRAHLPSSRHLRAFLAVRSRYAEDQLARAIASGTAQYVILGAGLDTFAHRNPYQGRLEVFEVDHPDTQRCKRRRLALAGLPLDGLARFVPLDFEHQRLDVELGRAGFEANEPAFFSWLGVTPYLDREVVVATFELIHGLHPGNAVAFDYALRPRECCAAEITAARAMSKRVARAGEPFKSAFEPEALARELARIGFLRVESPTAEQINALYFAGRLDGLRISGRLGALMCAWP